MIAILRYLSCCHIIHNGQLDSFQTFFGQIFGGFCALLGVFTLTLPIPIVVNSFAGFYKNRLWRNEVAHKKRERIQSQKDGGYSGMGDVVRLDTTV